MGTRTNVELHNTTADTIIDANIHHGPTPYASLTIGDEQTVDIYSHDPVFLRRLSNVASAVAHDLDNALANAQVSA